MPPQDLAISSSLLRAASYDDEAQELTLTFKAGAKWAYGNGDQPFTQDDFDAFAGASSHGQHFLQQIKGAFPERRV